MNSKRSARSRRQFRQAVLIVLLLRQRDILQRHRIKIVVGQRDEAEAHAAQLHDLPDHRVGRPLARLLSIGPPHGTERAVLGAAADGLHRSPHVAFGRHQIPARRLELVGRDAAAVVFELRGSLHAVGQSYGPHRVAIALYYRVRSAEFVSFVGIERRMNAAEDNPCSALASDASHFEAAQRVGGVDPDCRRCRRAGSSPAVSRSRVSSTISGSPYDAGVAAAST